MTAAQAIPALFADKRMRLLSAAAAVGRWQDSVTILSLLLAAHSAGLSLSQASFCTAVLALSAGLSSTFKARWMDRSGARVAIGALSVATGLGYIALVAALLLGQLWAVVAAAAILGAARTNSGMCMQVTWMSVIKDEDLKARAAGFENLINTIAQNTGPLLVGALVALWSPIAALAVFGAAISASMWLWSRSSVHAEAGSKRAAKVKTNWNIGGRVMSVAVGSMFIGILSGALQISVVGAAGSSAEAALLTAALAAGAGGACIYSVLRGFPFLNNLKAAALAGILALAVLLPLTGMLSPVLMGAALLLGGACFGLAGSAITLLLQKRAPEGRKAEAFSWRLTLTFVGVSFGQVAAGQLIGLLGVFLAGVLMGAAGLVFLAVAAVTLGAIRIPRLSALRPAFA